MHIPDTHRHTSVAAQRQLTHSPLSLTRRLLRLRRRRPALALGTYTSVDLGADACLAYERTHRNQRILVALNLEGRPLDLQLPPGRWRTLLSSHDDPPSTSERRLHLAGHEGHILESTLR